SLHLVDSAWWTAMLVWHLWRFIAPRAAGRRRVSVAPARPQPAEQSAALRAVVLRRTPAHRRGRRLGHQRRIERLGGRLAFPARDLDGRLDAQALLRRTRRLGGGATARDLKLLLGQRRLGALVLQLTPCVRQLAGEEPGVRAFGLGLRPR